ncbi:MAG: hypothetical protein Q7S96_03770 [bacterium]|nr:hypothetical protein [bacterium]
MDGKSLAKENAVRAFNAPGNIASGVIAGFCSIVLGPLPLILWGLGSSAWMIHATANRRYITDILKDEQAERLAARSRERDVLHRRITATMEQEPFAGWVWSSAIPHYLNQYTKLVNIRDRVARIANDRSEIVRDAEDTMLRRLDDMLTKYLKFVWSRIGYLQNLTGERLDLVEDAPVPPVRLSFMRRVVGALVVSSEGEDTVHRDPVERHRRQGSLDGNHLIGTIERQITNLQQLAQDEPATAAHRLSHARLLENRLSILQQCREHDRRVTAQLEAFPDGFDLILTRVSATQYQAEEVVQCMEALATDVEDTERFVEAMTPLMDGALSDIDLMVTTTT